MKMLSSLGRTVGDWLGIPESVKRGLPLTAGASMSPGELRPPGQAVNVITKPVETIAASALKPVSMAQLGLKVTPEMMADAMVRHQAKTGLRPTAGKAVAKPAAKSISPNVTDDDLPPPSKPDPESDEALPGIIKQLTEMLDVLKNRIAVTPDDDAAAKAALASLKAGKKLTACRGFLNLTKSMLVRAQAREKLSPSARTALAFNEQETVAALNAALRPRPVTPTATIKSVAAGNRFREITEEISALDKIQKQGFTNAGLAKHNALRREQATLRKQLHQYT